MCGAPCVRSVKINIIVCTPDGVTNIVPSHTSRPCYMTLLT